MKTKEIKWKEEVCKYPELGNCHICTSHCKTKAGYSFYCKDGKRRYIHVVVYEKLNGEIPENMEVCHKCDNAACINPEHLYIASHKNNMLDMVNRNRGNTQVLTPQQAKEIKYSTKSDKELSLLYGVKKRTVNAIKNGNRWKHV